MGFSLAWTEFQLVLSLELNFTVFISLQQRKGSTKAIFRGCIVLYVNLPIVQLAIVHATSSSRPSLMIFLDPEPDPDPGESQDFGPGPGGVPK